MITAVACCAVLAVASTPAPFRLRAEVLGGVQSPAGLVVLQGDSAARPEISAEALVWAGANELDREADALILALHLRDPKGRGEIDAGRLILTAGGLRPVHMDGGVVRARLPWRGTIEAFGGLPVAPRFGARDYDWLAGVRVAQAIGTAGGAGLAFLHRRDAGRLVDQEVAADLNLELGPFGVAARGAYDTINPGISEGHMALGARFSPLMIELFGAVRSPSRLLPASSLFSVLGDVASREAGAFARWRVAPRLELELSAAARLTEGPLAENLTARAKLWLDDRAEGLLGLELRRAGALDGGWSGARIVLRLPIAEDWTTSAELELARPDEPGDRGEWWPWGLLALGWSPEPWELAIAAEGRVSPEFGSLFDVIGRFSYSWSGL